VVCRQHDQVFAQQVLVSTFPEQMRRGCFQVLPLVLEFPFPDLMKKDCFLVVEFQSVEQVLAFQSLVRASLALQQSQLL
jgi:hypothetical protein